MQPLKIFFSQTAQQNSMILHTHGPWVCVIKVSSSGYNNNVKLYNIAIIVHCITGEH